MGLPTLLPVKYAPRVTGAPRKPPPYKAGAAREPPPEWVPPPERPPPAKPPPGKPPPLPRGPAQAGKARPRRAVLTRLINLIFFIPKLHISGIRGHCDSVGFCGATQG